MSAHSLRGMGIAACLIFLGIAPSEAKEEAPYYFLAVPVAQDGLVCMAALQLDRQGKPVLASKKSSPFFTIWRSGYSAEKEPDGLVKDKESWNKTLELRAEKAVAAKQEMGGLPAPLLKFFMAVETLRAGALNQPPVLAPLFQARGFVGWAEVAHLDVIAIPDTLGPKERSRQLLRTLGASQKEAEQDPAQWMKTFLENLGVKVQSARYWPEYNVFLFEGDAQFKEMVDMLLNATCMERSRLPAGPVCVMLPGL